ncbi:MAG: hypothetical protein ABI963_10050 [Rhizomicrobium sp.]
MKSRFAALIGTCLGLWASHAYAAELPSACVVLSKTMVAQPAGPVFLPSYPTVKSGPLLGAAFLYDNAVAAIALVACGESKKAARIGDAILIALDHDRYWHDGRLRNGYLAGAVGPEPVKLAGWWDDKQNMWVEDRYQVGSDSGNMAWAILALLALDQASGDHRYRDGAVRIAGWTMQSRSRGGPGGFTGGAFAHEPTPVIEKWKSTEHNTDLAAAFSGLARATGDKKWMAPARVAQKFVRAMWSAACQCFAVGTIEDGKTRNPYLALDAQIWPLLALQGAAADHDAALATAQSRLRDGDGFAYSEAKEGMWTEGTAQVALYLNLSGRKAEVDHFMAAIDGMRAADGSYYAANTRELPTGFMLETDPTQPRQYFHIAHLAAISWAAIAGQGYNPFTRTKALP